MINDDTPKRGRGRPPKPKEPKVPKRMGRPTVWDERHGKTAYRKLCAPEQFFKAWEDFEFRKKISDLLLDFNRVK